MPSRMPVVNGICSAPASRIMARRSAGSLSGACWCAPPRWRSRGLTDLEHEAEADVERLQPLHLVAAQQAGVGVRQQALVERDRAAGCDVVDRAARGRARRASADTSGRRAPACRRGTSAPRCSRARGRRGSRRAPPRAASSTRRARPGSLRKVQYEQRSRQRLVIGRKTFGEYVTVRPLRRVRTWPATARSAGVCSSGRASRCRACRSSIGTPASARSSAARPNGSMVPSCPTAISVCVIPSIAKRARAVRRQRRSGALIGTRRDASQGRPNRGSREASRVWAQAGTTACAVSLLRRGRTQAAERSRIRRTRTARAPSSSRWSATKLRTRSSSQASKIGAQRLTSASHSSAGKGPMLAFGQRGVVEGRFDLARIEIGDQLVDGVDEALELRRPHGVREEVAVQGAAQQRLVDVDAAGRSAAAPTSARGGAVRRSSRASCAPAARRRRRATRNQRVLIGSQVGPSNRAESGRRSASSRTCASCVGAERGQIVRPSSSSAPG